MQNKHKILVRVPNWIGDAVMSTPAIALLRQTAKNAHIAVLANEGVKDVFKFNPSVDEILTLKDGYFENARMLRQKEFDCGILFTNSFSSALIFFLSGIAARSGYSTDGRFLLLTDRIRRNRNFKKEHQVDYYLNIIKKAQKDTDGFLFDTAAYRLFWYVTEAEKNNADKMLKELAVYPTKDVIVGINPGASFGPAKRWFPERFAELADKLTEKYRAKIIVFGGMADREIAATVVKHMKSKPVNLAGKTDLRNLAALISKCNLFITNDTGPMHIAAAVGTRVLAIFGSTDPVRTGPMGNNHIIIHKDTHCSPCLKSHCVQNNYECLENIEPDDIIKLMPDDMF